MKEAGSAIEAHSLDDMRIQFEEFKKNLEDFAVHHKKEINENPVFRKQFHQMCQEIGVDPLSSQKGFWADLLGFGDFYYELGVYIFYIYIYI